MKQPNGYGSVVKLTGNRRRPYMVRITTGTVYNEETQKSYCQRTVLGYYRTRAEALTALGAYNSNPYNLDSKSVTLKEIWNQIKDSVNVSDSRKKVYESTFDRYLFSIANMKMSDIKTAHLQQIIDTCGHGYSTQSIIRSVLNQIYLYSIQNDIVEKDYVKYIKLESQSTEMERQIYTTDEIINIWNNKNNIDYAFTLVLLHQGMRIKELRDMLKKDINLDDNTMTITQGKNSFSVRTIPINQSVKDIILNQMKLPGTHLFDINKSHYEHFVTNNLNHRAYDTRHTFASKCNELNVKTIAVQKIMGHKPDTVLEQVYTHISIDELQREINKVCYQPVTN